MGSGNFVVPATITDLVVAKELPRTTQKQSSKECKELQLQCLAALKQKYPEMSNNEAQKIIEGHGGAPRSTLQGWAVEASKPEGTVKEDGRARKTCSVEFTSAVVSKLWLSWMQKVFVPAANEGEQPLEVIKRGSVNVMYSYGMIRMAAKDCKEEFMKLHPDDEHLAKAEFSDKWVRDYLMRTGFRRHTVNNSSTKRPDEVTIKKHYDAIQTKAEEMGVSKDEIANFDETAFNYGSQMLNQYVLGNEVAKDGTDTKQRLTAALGVTGGGENIPAMYIAKCTVAKADLSNTTVR